MREILFRGKRTDCDEWIMGYYCHTNEMDFIMWGFGGIPTPVGIDPATVGQYTGLCDKNGKKIFEGDIVRMLEIGNDFERRYVTDIKWEDAAFVMKSGGADYDTFLLAWAGDPNSGYPLHEIEVVGDVHDNPELLT